jgi:hypothetical protein
LRIDDFKKSLYYIFFLGIFAGFAQLYAGLRGFEARDNLMLVFRSIWVRAIIFSRAAV